MKKRFVLLILSVTVIPLLISVMSCSTSTEPVGGSSVPDTLSIGVIIPMTGSGPLQKDPELAAIEIATEDFNQALAEEGSNTRITAEIRDSQFSGTSIQSALEEFHENGLNIVVFSGTSGNLNGVKPFIDDNDILLVNPTSTAVTLSLQDNIFRLVPDDHYLADVMAKMLGEQGIAQTVLLFRGDIWGAGLASELETQFEAAGGTVIASIGYDPRFTTADLQTAVESLNTELETALTSADAATIAVTCICYEEGVELLNLASQQAEPGRVKWYGSDGMVQNQALLDDAAAAAFASSVGFYCPIIAESLSAQAISVRNRIAQKIGYVPYEWAILLYDAFRAAAQTRIDQDDNANIADLKNAFEAVVADYDAITGEIVLNDNGDRESYDYDFWSVSESGNQYLWAKSFTISE